MNYFYILAYKQLKPCIYNTIITESMLKIYWVVRWLFFMESLYHFQESSALLKWSIALDRKQQTLYAIWIHSHIITVKKIALKRHPDLKCLVIETVVLANLELYCCLKWHFRKSLLHFNRLFTSGWRLCIFNQIFCITYTEFNLGSATGKTCNKFC